MASLSEMKKNLPSDSVCPFCGRILTTENAEIDHIIPISMGGTNDSSNLRFLCKECNVRKADKHDRLFEYYLRLMRNKGLSDDTSSKKIDYMLRNMSEKDLEALDNRIENMDPAYKRLMAYATAISKLSGKTKDRDIEPSNDEIAKGMSDSLKAFDGYNVDSKKRIFVNGNTFLYEEGFPIEEYMESLNYIGEDEKDEIFTVYLDDEGRLVIA